MKRVRIAALVVAAVFAVGACGSDDDGGAIDTGEGTDTTVAAPDSGDEPAAAGGNAVAVKTFNFNPASLTVKAGDAVTWTNEDETSHTVTADSGDAFDGKLDGKGKTFEHTFDEAGTFAYHCELHPSMKGTIVVE